MQACVVIERHELYFMTAFDINIDAKYVQAELPCGLVARIRRSHRRGRGSIPRTGDVLSMHTNITRDLSCQGHWHGSKRNAT